MVFLTTEVEVVALSVEVVGERLSLFVSSVANMVILLLSAFIGLICGIWQ